jgi:hypothetical protein
VSQAVLDRVVEHLGEAVEHHVDRPCCEPPVPQLRAQPVDPPHVDVGGGVAGETAQQMV